MPASESNRLAILAILSFGLVLRIGWAMHRPGDEKSLANLPDQVEYLSLGKSLLHQHQLSFFDSRFDQTVYAYRTPGYPVLVALCDAKLVEIRLVQAVLDASTVLAIYLLASRWMSKTACLFAAFLVAIDPFLIYFSGLILSESLFIAMLAWGMALLARRQHIPLKLCGALILAMSVLVRPSALFLPTALIVAEDFINAESGKTNRNRRVLRSAIFGIALTFAVLLPWALRNQRLLGKAIWTTTNSGITSYDGFNPHADGSSNQTFTEDMPELRLMNEVERSAYLSGLARRYAMDHPGRAIELAILKIARTWSPVPLSEEYGSRRLYAVAAACWSIPLDLLMVWGLWSAPISRAAKVYCLMPALYFTAVHAISVGSLRYRIPAEAIMCVVASGVGFRVSGFGKRQDESFTRDPIPETRNPI